MNIQQLKLEKQSVCMCCAWSRVKVARRGDHGGQFAYVMGCSDFGLSRRGAYAAIRRTGTGSHIWQWTVCFGQNVFGTRRGSCRTLTEAKAVVVQVLDGLRLRDCQKTFIEPGGLK